MEQVFDEQLVRNYLSGDEEAFEVLLERYLTPIYNFVARQIGDRVAAQDVTQEVFVKAWKSLWQFDQTKQFKVWLFRIARNSAIDYLRLKKAVPFSQLGNKAGGEPIADRIVDNKTMLPSERLERQAARDEMDEALALLPASYRTVMVLYYQEQLNFREIAQATGQSINSIKSRHRRALAKLRDILKKPF